MRAFASVTKSKFVFEKYSRPLPLLCGSPLLCRLEAPPLRHPQPAVLQFRVCTDALVCPHSRVSRSP